MPMRTVAIAMAAMMLVATWSPYHCCCAGGTKTSHDANAAPGGAGACCTLQGQACDGHSNSSSPTAPRNRHPMPTCPTVKVCSTAEVNPTAVDPGAAIFHVHVLPVMSAALPAAMTPLAILTATTDDGAGPPAPLPADTLVARHCLATT